jgi:hypothetical protein
MKLPFTGREIQHPCNNNSLRAVVCFGMMWSFLIVFTELRKSTALAHGFNANRVHIVRTLQGLYRVTIQYTHAEAGEYREAHIDFTSKEEALKAYEDLAKGADFFLGAQKGSIHFHTPPQNTKPY